MPLPVLYAVLAANLATFLAFGVDKWKARRSGARRVRESTLLLMAWATGLLGAWAGMAVFRHKTRKTAFKVRMGLVSLFNPLWVVLWISSG